MPKAAKTKVFKPTTKAIVEVSFICTPLSSSSNRLLDRSRVISR